MLAEIITIGDEILIGQIVDTNSAFIAKELNKIGVQVYQITSIQDDREHILQALREANKRVELVLVTGGLGPTNDDITKKTFSEFIGDALVEDADTLQHIKDIFGKYLKRDPLPTNLEQAMVLSSAVILKNIHGTAPGMWMEKGKTVFVSMPGVPYEMKHLMRREVLPRVVRKFNRPFIYHKTLLTYGQGESTIADRIESFENSLPNTIKLAYLPSLGRVRLRLSTKGSDQAAIQRAIDERMEVLSELLSDIAVGFEEETTIQERIGAILKRKGQTLSLAESCTGGAIAEEITAVPGASDYFVGSITPYETKQKVRILGIAASLIEKHTVVSAEVAEAMAIKCCQLFDSDLALATTGIAGPTKGDGKAEIGTVFIAIAYMGNVVVEKFSFGKARERVIQKATNKAFELLLKEISKN